ncbi:UNVERIFIED_ORG: hypothetical protein J2791_006188 [Burkholderia contaminans]|nr:hypothetical protein [Burkholderia contaminans]
MALLLCTWISETGNRHIAERRLAVVGEDRNAIVVGCRKDEVGDDGTAVRP